MKYKHVEAMKAVTKWETFYITAAEGKAREFLDVYNYKQLSYPLVTLTNEIQFIDQ